MLPNCSNPPLAPNHKAITAGFVVAPHSTFCTPCPTSEAVRVTLTSTKPRSVVVTKTTFWSTEPRIGATSHMTPAGGGGGLGGGGGGEGEGAAWIT